MTDTLAESAFGQISLYSGAMVFSSFSIADSTTATSGWDRPDSEESLTRYINWYSSTHRNGSIAIIEPAKPSDPEIITRSTEPSPTVINNYYYNTVKQPKEQHEKEVLPMFTTSTVIGIIVIVIITVKFIIPRLTWRYVIGKIVRVFYRPAKKEINTVKNEWQQANMEEDIKN